ncbi:MAG: hypothetical protein Fur0021_14980 [Candidatus Promineifilaceae bacterium]
MLAPLSNTLQKYAKGWLIVALLALEILFNAVILPQTQARLEASSGGAGPIDLLFFYTPEQAYSMIASYGDGGRAAYRTFELTGDIIYPIVYTLFFSLLITWLFQRGFAANSKVQKLNVVPFGGGLFDLLENLCIVAMLSVFPSTPAFVAVLATIFTMLKWGFAGAAALLILVGLVMAVKNGFRGP